MGSQQRLGDEKSLEGFKRKRLHIYIYDSGFCVENAR